MDINSKFEDFLEKNNISYDGFDVVETDFGYILQINKSRNTYQILLNKDLHFLCDFMQISNTIDSIYSKFSGDSLDNLVIEPVNYCKLDENYWLLPYLKENNPYHVLLYFDKETNQLECKDTIQGHINEPSEKLANAHSFIVYNHENEKDNRQEYLYSWTAQKKTSDYWTRIANSERQTRLIILNNKRILPDIEKYILDLLRNDKLLFATIEFRLCDNDSLEKKMMHLFGLIHTNGLPATDLFYISEDYELKTIPINDKTSIGEVQNTVEQMKQRIELRDKKIENNKNNLLSSFSNLLENSNISPKISHFEDKGL